MTLDDLRKKIDDIDTELVSLLKMRMDAIERVALFKQEQGLAVFHPEREKAILQHLDDQLFGDGRDFYIRSLYQYMLDLSKTRQREILRTADAPVTEFSEMLDHPLHELSEPNVLVQGIQGSFASSAAMRMYPHGKLHHTESWEDVLDAVQHGACDYGVLPIENSSAGSVTEVYDLVIKYNHAIVKAVPCAVEQCLLGVRGTKLSDIRKVYSHPMAFPQCSDFFHCHLRYQRVPVANTAIAAEYVAREGKREYAAIASRECAQLYGLDILAENVQQNKLNTTRFISVSRRRELSDDANKVSLVFTLPHVTGSLYRALQRFALRGLNLTKIESRPNPEKNFEYFFYIDGKGSIRSPGTLSLLTALSEELPFFRFLGNYHEP